MTLTIGSSSAYRLMMGKKTKGYRTLFQEFVSDEKKYYNAYASPIDALRTGAILEDNFIGQLGEGWYSQQKTRCSEIDCLVSTLDFALLENGRIINFRELKTIFFTDYIDKIVPLKSLCKKDQQEAIKKGFKSVYAQVQFQMLCAGILECELCFLSVESYDDDENVLRHITNDDYTVFDITADKVIINAIRKRSTIFQTIKDNFNDGK